jgi:hypothetical protein
MTVTSFKDFPLADRDRPWDASAAEKRVRRWTGTDDKPNATYRDAHVWYDAADKDAFGAYKLAIADVIDDKLQAVPRAIMAAGGVMQGGRGGIDLPQKDIPRVKSHLAKYYKKMGETPPWERDRPRPFGPSRTGPGRGRGMHQLRSPCAGHTDRFRRRTGSRRPCADRRATG